MLNDEVNASSLQGNNSDDENSDGGLRIVVESPRLKRKSITDLDESDKEIIASIEEDLEQTLEEKASKANLTAVNVKNILKQVVTNEHVIALLRRAENPDDNDKPVTPFEPKFTRAKTKELLSSTPQTPVIPWAPLPESRSEVQVLFSEDLQEDSSGDEYVPEPTKSAESELNTSQMSTEEANIARRTRSKLCLSHTPLEAIEEAFIPPDITTDMYDMDCDDDVWKDFLKAFTKPLDEITKTPEDPEDHDPEYNILADIEVDEVDREELRADRAVTVSRKELNHLMAELFEFADFYKTNDTQQICPDQRVETPVDIENSTSQIKSVIDAEDDPNIIIKRSQLPLLMQQMTQHVQMLAQNFLLTYEHPELSDMAGKLKDCLLSLRDSTEGKISSMFYTVNLFGAIKIVEYWERLFATNCQEVLDTKRHVERVIVESLQAKVARTEYVITFPPLLMEVISKSEVFVYPNLLPRIPFRSNNYFASAHRIFTQSENNLIALYLEKFIPQLKQDSKPLNLRRVSYQIHAHLLHWIDHVKVDRHIKKMKNANAEENPIKYYFRNNQAPPTVHYVAPLNIILPPCQRDYDSLPILWQKYIYPDHQKEQIQIVNLGNNQTVVIKSPHSQCSVTKVARPPVYNVKFVKRYLPRNRKPARILPSGPLPPTVTYNKGCCARNRKKPVICACGNDISLKKVKILKQDTMLPDMPNIGTPIKTSNFENETETNKDHENNEKSSANTSTPGLSFHNVSSFNFQYPNSENSGKVRLNFEGLSEICASSSSQGESTTTDHTAGKDNPDDINEFMIASSTVKTVPKKEPSGAEKKRAKLRREFVANLTMATPDDFETEKQKENDFADSFFDKLRVTLEPGDYNKIIDILGHYDENNGEFVELYHNVQSILSPKYTELADEFLLFLTDLQAHKIGELMPYFMMKDMARLMKKMRVYFKDQPSQMRKIIKCMNELVDIPVITIEQIKSTILPLLKGNAALTGWFLQIFPCERPSNMLVNGPFEVVDMCKEVARQPDEEIYETIKVPDTEDMYGGVNCICSCHNDDNEQCHLHCNKCGVKFIQGKVFVQTGKSLRPAVVSFLTNPEKDQTDRLMATQRKRSDTSPNKQTASPSKEHHEGHRHSNESEEDADGGKKAKRRRKEKSCTKTTRAVKEATPKSNKASDKTKTVSKPAKVPKRAPRKRVSNKKPRTPLSSPVKQRKRLAEEPLEVEFNERPEYVEMKISSDHSGESESECFESSQDVTNTDSEDSNLSLNSGQVQQSKSVENASWTRSEDKIILQAFRQRSDSDETFKHIAELLKTRTVTEIKGRFQKLMNLLQKMSSSMS